MNLLRSKVFVFALILVLVAGVIMLVAWHGDNNTLLGQAVGAILTPLENGVTAVTDWVADLFGYFYRYSALEAENTALKEDLAAYRALELEYWAAVNENDQLRQLSRLSKKYTDFAFEPASVISIEGSGFESSFLINKGSIDGIEIDDCVVTEVGTHGGIIGYVSEIGPNYARIVTLINLNSKISAIISRTREVVVAEGDFRLAGEGLLKISYLRNDADIKVGDWIETSGDGKYYPKGLIIGQVEEIGLESTGLGSYATIRPTADLNALNGVFVVKEFGET